MKANIFLCVIFFCINHILRVKESKIDVPLYFTNYQNLFVFLKSLYLAFYNKSYYCKLNFSGVRRNNSARV